MGDLQLDCLQNVGRKLSRSTDPPYPMCCLVIGLRVDLWGATCPMEGLHLPGCHPKLADEPARTRMCRESLYRAIDRPDAIILLSDDQHSDTGSHGVSARAVRPCQVFAKSWKSCSSDRRSSSCYSGTTDEKLEIVEAELVGIVHVLQIPMLSVCLPHA